MEGSSKPAACNHILLKLEAVEKAKVLIKELTKVKYLYALKLLFENPFNQFSPQVLRDSLNDTSYKFSSVFIQKSLFTTHKARMDG
ncbi:hypothetical protein C1645_828682 [Glomus cerebriforme]|uniref:Uncharacterized protein n=1 Tax=Glomus cerebriforme TaxID=658196 RepID=A0A397SLA3_9GLOM|nr:hypothetical protein C1645_828682 [Glomus cerebriforme]